MAYSSITKPTDHFSANTWVADDATSRSFTGFGHQPDFVWVKHRGSASINHTLVDSIRGGNKMLASNATAAEDTKTHGEITSFDSDGISVADGTNATYPRLYFNELDPFGSGGGNYVCWSWKANGTASSNTDGSITSSVSANTTSGFSIVSYTGTGSAATVGHGLGVTPQLVIYRRRNNNTSWRVMTTLVDGSHDKLYLNSTDAAAAVTESAPTSSLLNIGTQNEVNNASDPYIAYCFAEKKGFSKFGKYTGNGNADGTFVYTGFKPAWVMMKRAVGGTANWIIFDNKRDTFNETGDTSQRIEANLINAETQGNSVDFFSNGFKMKNTGAGNNNSGSTYIYMAFAENPLVANVSGGLPTTAR